MPDIKDFLPMTAHEMNDLGWDGLDVLIVSGDAYVDHPSFGPAVIGRYLLSLGYKTGIIAQPDWRDKSSFTVMGRPRLFCGVTAGNIDSMLGHYTAAKKKRHDDSYTAGNISGKRPNFPTIVYTQMLKSVFPGIPVVLGGIEASMRRATHYDFWENKVKPTILLPSKADILVYGMGEKAVAEIAERISSGVTDYREIRGTARLLGAKESENITENPPEGYNILPSFELCVKNKRKFLEASKMVEKELNPYCGRGVIQMHADRALIMEPPQIPVTQKELDGIYSLPFTGLPHPSYTEEIPAFTMVKDSVTILRGCAGGCSFCSLGLHQGKFIVSRSRDSITSEIKRLSERSSFRGTVSDLGGPTANLYGCANGVSPKCRGCRRPSCLYPEICKNFRLNASEAINLYRAARKISKVKHVFVNSGIRMDVAIKFPLYIKELASHHVSGHLKVAPEHFHSTVLRRMRKPDGRTFKEFIRLFESENKRLGKEQYLVPYFISGFPGCTEDEMSFVEEFLDKRRWNLQQVQSFIPLPMTAAAAMYYTGLDYETERPLSVIKSQSKRHIQKVQMTGTENKDKSYARKQGEEKYKKVFARKERFSEINGKSLGAKTARKKDEQSRVFKKDKQSSALSLFSRKKKASR